MNRLNKYYLIKNRQKRQGKPALAGKQFSEGLAHVFLACLSVALCVFLIIAGFSYAQLTNDLPSIEQLPVLLDRGEGELLQPSEMYDRSGTQLLYTLDNPGIVRKFLTVNPDAPDHFSLQLIRLVVAHLEPGFWTSNGVDLSTLTDPQPHTIAERLARELLLADEPDSARTALRMRLLANQIVSRYGRTQVLEWYLNSAYFGHLAYSAESAARLYLGKSAADLDLADSALLVSLIESPALDPLDAPAAALENQQKLLSELVSAGTITQEEYDTAAHKQMVIAAAPTTEYSTSSAFIQMAENQLIDLVGSTRVERGGLKVITTLDLDLQAQLVCTARNQLFQIESSSISGVAPADIACTAANYLPTQSYDTGIQGLAAAGLIMDTTTGQILAYSEPIDMNGQAVDAELKPGSLLSPFVALTAFARGSSPATLVWDVPSSLPVGAENEVNPDGVFHGPVNYRLALENDYVVPVAQVFQQYDTPTVWSIADAVGLDPQQSEDDSANLLFDGGSVSMNDIARAYGILASRGMQNGVLNSSGNDLENVTVLKVLTVKGQTLVDNHQPQQSSILSTSLAYLMNNILSDETSRWNSLGHPNALEIGRTVAAKIGQVAEKDQVWTVGYTPSRLVISWIGNSKNNEQTTTTSYRMAAGLWHALMQYSTKDLPTEDWDKPIDVSQVQVCSPSGMLPTNDCPTITNDVFIYGNEPTQYDDLYQKVKVNKETGLLATVFTPQELIEEDVFLNVPAAIRSWAINAGYKVVPQGYDAIATSATNPQVQITSPSLFSPVKGKVAIVGTAGIDSLASFNVQVGQGINPESWQQIGDTQTQAVTDGTLATWDTTGLDGLYAIRLNVVSASNEISTAVIQVTVDNQPPQVQVTYPSAGATVSPIDGAITLTASVTDSVGVARVEWWLDGKLAGEVTDPPYSFLWNSSKDSHKLQVKAWDTAGNEADSETMKFEVGK